MKVLVVDTTIQSNLIGGAQTFLVKALAAFVAAGHEVHLLAYGKGGGWLGEAIERTGATVHADLVKAGELVDDVTPRVADWVNKLRPDVYVVSVSPDIGWTVLPHLDPGIATLTIGHNDERTFYDPVKHYAPFLTRTVGVSEEICRKYRDECGMLAERVTWIPYGVETSKSGPTETEGDATLELVYVGRVEDEQKRIFDLVRVIRKLRQTDIRFRLNIVGDGGAMSQVRELLREDIELGRVQLHGWLDSGQVIWHMRHADVFMLTSEYEGFCISLIEAMANRCCPVVTDIESGNKQLVEDGVNGFVVPVGDVEAFVDRIKLLAGNRERLNEMRLEAWETGREYSIERMVSNYISCFEGAIEDARLNPRTPDPEFPLMESCRSKYPLWLRRLKAKAKKLATN